MIIKKSLVTLVCISSFLGMNADEPLRVGIYEGYGAAETCVREAVAASEMDAALRVRVIRSADLARGILDSLDVVVLPGGSGSRMYMSMGESNRRRLTSFVEDGGGLVGICAGAYLTSSTPEYSCLDMSGGEAVDIEHDNRGRGVAKVTLTEEGKRLFPEVASRDTLYVMYYEGPVIRPREGSRWRYSTYGMMESDVHVEGNAPAGMTPHRPFFYQSTYGKGKVFSSVGHPEATPGMQWMLSRMIHSVCPNGKKVQPQLPTAYIQPNMYERELLMDGARREKEENVYRQLLAGNAEERIAGMRWIGDMLSWDGKRWLQGMLFDSEPAVRAEAANVMARCLYRYYLPDLKAALKSESDKDVREVLRQAIGILEGKYYFCTDTNPK